MSIKPLPLLMSIALITLTACSSDNLEEQQPVGGDEWPVVFAGQMQDETEVTRAALSDVTTSFRVWAYKNTADNDAEGYTAFQTVINGYTVNWSNQLTTTNSEGWEYVNGTTQTVKYWDFNAVAYRFFGYAPADAAVTTNTTDDALTLSLSADARTTETIAAAPYISDLWFSTGYYGDYPDRQFGEPVKMTFAKPFARVHFLFTFANGATLDRSDLSSPLFHPINSSARICTAGTVTLTYPLTGTATAYNWATSVSNSISGLTDDSQWYTVLPAATQGAYEMTVTVGSENRSATVPAEMMQWLPGYDYTYIFKITEDQTVTFSSLQINLSLAEDWQSGNYNYTEIGD